MKLKEWQNHVVDERTTNLGGKKVAFCGEPLGYEWSFTGPGHAISSIMAGSRLSPCPACAKKMIEYLKESLETIDVVT